METKNWQYLGAAALGAVILVQTHVLPNPMGQSHTPTPPPVVTPAPPAVPTQPGQPQPVPTQPGQTQPIPTPGQTSGQPATNAQGARQTLVQAASQILAPCVQAAKSTIADVQQASSQQGGSQLPAQTGQDAAATQQACTQAEQTLQTLPPPDGLQNDPTAARFMQDTVQIAAALADFGQVVQGGLQQGFSSDVIAHLQSDLQTATSANQDTAQIMQAWGLASTSGQGN